MAEVVASIEGNVVAGAKLEGAKREVATSDREESALIQPIGSALSTMATKLLGGMPAYQPIAQVYTHADVEQAMRDLIAGHIRKVCRGDTHRMSMMKRQARLMHGDGTPIETANLALLRQIARGLGVDASRWPVVGSARVEIMTPVVPA